MRRAALIAFACLLAGACARPVWYALDDSVSGLGLALPAPPRSWHATVAGRADVTIEATVVWGEALYDSARPATSSAIIDDQFYAIAADWLAPQTDTAASMPLAQAILVAEPLRNIVLPRVALPCDGLYPGQAGYALRRRVVVSARIGAGQPSGKLLGGAADTRLASEVAAYIGDLPEATAARGLVWVGAVGDMKPVGPTAALLEKPDGPRLVFGGMLPVMRSQDMLAGNLETAVTSRGSAWPKTYRFRMPALAIGALLDSGIDVVEIANNHVYDYSATGFADTVDGLRDAGMKFVGAGMSFDQATSPYSADVGDEHVSLWALAAFPVDRTGFSGLRDAAVQRGQPGLLWADDRAIRSIFDSMRASSAGHAGHELDIVSVHAGTEYSATPDATQTALYRRLIEGGADVVLGHHPHVLQPMEWYRGPGHSGLIVYSLGNFVFGGMDGIPAATQTVLLSLGVLDGRVRAIRLYGGRLSGGTVDSVADGAVERHLYAISRAWNGQRKPSGR